jgi:tRNA A-37 threonylcarbamoyl transferase component Bud32/tetratricopeptide (TPR) repeat protein
MSLELPGYELLERVGAGAAGVVYRARQSGLERIVAVKVLAIPAADARQVARQRQEAAVLARLNHPNIVQIHEVQEHRGCIYLVMEYVDGGTMASQAGDTLLSPREAAELTFKLAQAVQAMHEAGVLHRDLKPSNVLLTQGGEPKITDFGLAKLRSGESALTTADSVLGTPSYMSPEQALGNAESVGPAADVYSVGAILYELLTGRAPFLGATVLDTLALIRMHEPAPPRRLQPTIPRDLETICLHCLSKSPQGRYGSAGELASDLRRFLEGKPITARRATALETAVRWSRRNPMVASLTAAVAALVVTTLAMLMWTNYSIRQAAADKDAALATARGAVDQMLTRVAKETLHNMPLGHPLRQAMLEDALEYYEGFLDNAEADTSVHENMTLILNSLALLQRESGHFDEACGSFERSIKILQSAVERDPRPPALREQLAAAQEGLAYTWQINPADEEGKQADRYYREALDTYRDLERQWPRRRQPTMLCTRYLGERAFYRDDLQEAETLWRETIADGEVYLKQQPGDSNVRSILCWTCADLADAILLPGGRRAEEAEDVLRDGLRHAAIALASNPRSSQTREATAFLNCRMAQCYCWTKRAGDSITLFRRAVEEMESLCAEFPWNGGYWSNLVHIREAAVSSLQATGRQADARAALERMVKWSEGVAVRIPDEPAPQASFQRCQRNLVRLLRSAGEEDEAAKLQRLMAAER